MALEEYRKKRKFEKTPEPPPESAATGGNSFVVQQHDATRMHWDLRLEVNGVLASWAVPKGPSLNPEDKRLAVHTEDHPLNYAGFEGVIPEGNYGAGPVMVWDRGTYEVEGKGRPAEQIARGEIKFRLHGRKLRGGFVLVHSGKRAEDPKERQNWLLIKHRDESVDPNFDIERLDWSVLSGRTLAEIAAGGPGHAGSARELPGAREAPMPALPEPMLATLIGKPFSDSEWLFELKWDGMRLLARVRDGTCELRSRRGRAVTSQFPELERLPERLAVKEAIVDGEVVVLDERGHPDFNRIQHRMNVARPPRALLEREPITYYVFDILYCDGYDLRAVPLIERKRFLKRVLLPEPPVRFSDHVMGQGEELYRLARQERLEGIVGKHVRSRYEARRSREWVKLKTAQELDAVVGGYTAPRGAREHFGALLAGLYDDKGALRFIGGVGTGFAEASAKSLHARLAELATPECPFAGKPATREKSVWVKPELVARVRFTELTRDRRLRAPVFLGLRADIDPKDCRFESAQEAPEGELPELCRSKAETVSLEIEGRPLRFTHLDKVYFPEPGLTKRDLLCYYARVAPLILPFLRERPLVLRRMPEGLNGELFYQKDAGQYAAGWMTTVPIRDEETGKEVRYFVCNDLAALLYLTNLGCIDHDPWASRIDDLRRPDYLFLDLDPTDKTPFSTVVEVARAAYDVFTEAGLKAYLKTSGATGFHIYVPLERVYGFEQATRFTEIVARMAAARVPDRITFERIVARRPPGRVLLDYAQLAYSRPLASVYSVRPEPAATVSAPVRADELGPLLDPRSFTIKTMPARIAKLGDLWADFWESRQRLEPALEKLRARVAESKKGIA
jgi:bifunctional non-homologous end joining protein LigD